MSEIVMKLKEKYTSREAAKFGGKKRGAGNSGGMGPKGRALKRAYVVSQRLKSRDNGPNQYALWARAMGMK